MTVKLLAPHPPYVTGDLFTADANTEAGLVALGIATTNTAGGTSPNFQQTAASTSAAGWTVLTADYRVSASDDGACFACRVPLMTTFPDGLQPRPNVVVMPPSTGVASLVGRLNSSSVNTLTRSRASNRTGVAITANEDADTYGVGGS